MGILDKLTGTRHPEDGVVPRPAEELRNALLALNRPDVPYVIRDGASDGADLVAEWRIAEPAWQTFFIGSQLTHAIRIRMRLAGESHEVRAVEEQWEVTRVGDPLGSGRRRSTGAARAGPSRAAGRSSAGRTAASRRRRPSASTARS